MNHQKQIKIIQSWDRDNFQAQLQSALNTGWVPLYQTFQQQMSSFVILVEKPFDINHKEIQNG